MQMFDAEQSSLVLHDCRGILRCIRYKILICIVTILIVEVLGKPSCLFAQYQALKTLCLIQFRLSCQLSHKEYED